LGSGGWGLEDSRLEVVDWGLGRGRRLTCDNWGSGRAWGLAVDSGGLGTAYSRLGINIWEGNEGESGVASVGCGSKYG